MGARAWVLPLSIRNLTLWRHLRPSRGRQWSRKLCTSTYQSQKRRRQEGRPYVNSLGDARKRMWTQMFGDSSRNQGQLHSSLSDRESQDLGPLTQRRKRVGL